MRSLQTLGAYELEPVVIGVSAVRCSDLFEATGRVLVQQARDERLIRQAFRQRPLLDRLQGLARQPDVQPSVLFERRSRIARVARSFALASGEGSEPDDAADASGLNLSIHLDT